MKITSLLLVIIQFGCIAYFAIITNFKNLIPLSWVIFVLSILLGLFSIAIMKWNNFSVMPEPKINGRLIIKGPYKFIRHPMYTSVLALCLSFLLSAFTFTGVIIYCILIIDLVYKINREEKYLNNKFSEYASFSKRTKKIIPFIW